MRAISLAALLCLAASPGAAQTAGDSVPIPSSPDRYVISDLLVGQVPGLLVMPGWGLNGSGARIRFAGVRSMLDDAPLILVDGMRVDAAEDASLLGLSGPGPLRLEDLSVEDVESIEVVRGPASGAVYGPGAANGVISIHTKGGRSGPLRWETYAQGALETVHSNWPANYGGVDLDNATLSMRTGGCNLTAQAVGQCVQDFVQSFNPLVQRSPFETVLRRQVGFSATGGPSWGAFRVSGGVDGDAGPYAIPGVSRTVDDFRRWNLRGTGSIRPVPGLDIDVGLTRVSSDLRLPTYRPIQAALLGPSNGAQFVWDSVFRYPGGQLLDRTSWMIEARGTVLPWLNLRGALGRDGIDQRDGLVDPGLYRFDGRRQVVHRTAALSASIRGPALGRVRLGTTIGVERLGRQVDESEIQARDTTPFCAPLTPCLASQLLLQTRSTGAYLIEDVVVHDRLSITGALRYDRFSELDFSKTSPSLAVSWLARDGAPGVLNRLQLRGSYGSAATAPPPDVTFTLGPSPFLTSFIEPDRTRSFEVGADAGLLGGTWTAGLTFYDMRSDITVFQPLPQPFPIAYGLVSGTRIGNRGVAATLAGRLLDRSTLGWDVRLSLWGNRNRIVKLGLVPFGFESQFYIDGDPAGSYRAPRIRSFADANGDGVIVPSEVVVDSLSGWAGTPYPTQGASLNTGLRLGRWRVSTMLEYRAGHTLFNRLEWLRCTDFRPVCRGRHDPTASLREQAVAAAATAGPTVDYFEDADFLKVRDLSVSFDVPASVMSALRARGATITLVGRNLLTWTGYSGPDPEAGSYPLSAGGFPPTVADIGTLPPLRSWTLRVQLAY